MQTQAVIPAGHLNVKSDVILQVSSLVLNTIYDPKQVGYGVIDKPLTNTDVESCV